jgi:hypothetical protein
MVGILINELYKRKIVADKKIPAVGFAEVAPVAWSVWGAGAGWAGSTGVGTGSGWGGGGADEVKVVPDENWIPPYRPPALLDMIVNK